MKLNKLLAITALLAFVGSVYAEGVPGRTRPIRVGIFKGTGSGRYWHTNIHTAGNSIASMLASPLTSGLGDSVVTPDSGFTFSQYGLPSGTGTPTAGQTSAFIAALDTLDVAIISCMVEIGNIFGATGTSRATLHDFAMRKGYIAAHATTDSYGTWAALDTVHAARFQNHPSSPSERNGRLRLDSVGNGHLKPVWKFLNTGLSDTTFLEEWFSFTQNADVIRAYSNLTTTVNIDENSYAQGNPPSINARVMGADHPMSWYRTFSQGGRFFYTAVGHRSQNYTGTGQPRFLRRQLYNAILWASGYDTTMTGGGGTSINPRVPAPGAAANYSRISLSPSSLTVTMVAGGSHVVELITMDGRRIGFQSGEGQGKAYTFSVRPGVYALAVSTADGRSNRLVTIQ